MLATDLAGVEISLNKSEPLQDGLDHMLGPGTVHQEKARTDFVNMVQYH